MVDDTNKQKILIVDDTPENIQILMETLKDDYKIVAAINGEKALKMAEMVPFPDIILLDIMMPGMDGYEVCNRLKNNEKTKNIPVIFITALSEEEDEAKGLALGAVDYIAKPINPELVKARVRNHLELKGYRDHLEKLVGERTREVMLTQAIMIESLGTLAEYRDPETGGHIKRTQNYVKALAQHLKDHPRFRNELNDETIELLYISAPLHDVGKIGVRDHVLMKPGKLTDEEFEIMKKHTKFGHDALHITEQKLGKSSFLRYAREIAFSHQEKWDGSGYPQGLKGDEIPISGRLMALADVYDALISKRVYKPPFPHEKAVSIIMEGKETHFDPDIVDAFIKLENTFRNIALTFADFEEERQMLEGGKPIEAKDCKRIEKILLVEDNEINLEIMQSQLVSLGYQVDTAINGKQALIKFQKKNYDIILTDLEMPEMDGYALAAEIRQIEENSKEPMPILAVTASDFDLTKERAISLGFNGYMLKPFEIDVLEKKLASIICAKRDGL
ncbi:MAG: response regulator [Deltaproteobacteria bacterium]|jgi:putative two-component system response regulator|nr:response regulator [Deltaproteobacteria bacterium]MBW2571326.1 response regulator [Deltaproteobacteria bacterium]NOQ19835.1 response regulator [Desulfobacterales bacterium]